MRWSFCKRRVGQILQRPHHFGDSLVGRAARIRISQAVDGIFANGQDRNLVGSTADSGELGKHFMAVAALFEHTTHTPNLSLHTLQAID
jgi:hypothetical protein